jgi:anthranilate/para-aminobenzoate synthase component II
MRGAQSRKGCNDEFDGFASCHGHGIILCLGFGTTVTISNKIYHANGGVGHDKQQSIFSGCESRNSCALK